MLVHGVIYAGVVKGVIYAGAVKGVIYAGAVKGVIYARAAKGVIYACASERHHTPPLMENRAVIIMIINLYNTCTYKLSLYANEGELY